jgi:hypothetical protein
MPLKLMRWICLDDIFLPPCQPFRSVLHTLRRTHMESDLRPGSSDVTLSW